MSAQDRYIDAIERGLGGYHAMWPPGADTEPGAFGTLDDRVFDPKGHLQDYEEVDIDDPDLRPDGLTYGSERGLDVKLKVGGSGQVTGPLVNVDLGVEITFHDREQVALRATDVQYVRVRDERRFSERVVSAFRGGHVRIGDYFVTGIITAGSGAAAVSGEKGAKLELTGKGDVTPGAGVSLGNLKADISIASSSKTALQLPMKSGFVVAIRLVRLIDDGIIRVRPKVVDAPADVGGEPEYVLTFEEVAQAG
jgi:hypothetical protein